MEIQFSSLHFSIIDGQVLLDGMGNFPAVPQDKLSLCRIAEVQVLGYDKDSHLGVKSAYTSEFWALKYHSHTQEGNVLSIVQRSNVVEVTSVFTKYDDCNAVRVHTEVKNISNEPIVLEEVSAFTCYGFASNDPAYANSLYFTRFQQSHHVECQPARHSFADLGMRFSNKESQRRIAFANVGTWSTKEELPQGIIEDEANGAVMMFQIESNHSWYYEISDKRGAYYAWLGTANVHFTGWSKRLQIGETYSTVSVAVAFGKTVGETLCEMTKYRRRIAGKCVADETLPSIFNEYMHLSWDSPSAATTAVYAPVVADMGVEYYVIDCGWHDEEDGNIIYPYVGKWMQSNKRFPQGVRATTDFIRSLGMKAGLWIEPEIIGKKCAEMLDFYDDDCFLQRHGKRLCTMGRMFLDYRNPKVVAYMSETIRRMVEDYGADYIKMDYNEDAGIGTDYQALTAGEGLESATRAYLAWIDGLRARFPNVLFETCSSGGMRMDYETLSHFSIVSTSDQIHYQKYPYIAGNILAAVTPEQAAVWSYPVDSGFDDPSFGFEATAEWVDKNIPDEQVVMNMINSFLGRMHLASHLELLSKEKQSLVKEGVAYYNAIREAKKSGLPYFPCGFTRFGETFVASGFTANETLYLAVWNLGGERTQTIALDGIAPVSAKIAYPQNRPLSYALTGKQLTIQFTEDYQARMFEIKLGH